MSDIATRLKAAWATLPVQKFDGRTPEGQAVEFRRGWLFAIERLIECRYESPVEALLDATETWEDFNHGRTRA